MKKSVLIIILCLIGLALVTSSVLAYGFGDSIGLIDQSAGQTGLTQKDPGVIFAGIIKAILGLLGAIFITLIIYGGITWMIAGGNDQRVGSAKKVLTSAVLGLVLVIGSYSITIFIATAIERAGPIANPEDNSVAGGGPGTYADEGTCTSLPNASCKTYDACTKTTCVGGNNPGSTCQKNSDCRGGGECKSAGSLLNGLCQYGPSRSTEACVSDNDCTDGTCWSRGCGNSVCCQISPTSPVSDTCDQCGQGALNACDVTECNNRGDCVFYNSKCIERGDCAKCGAGLTNICDAAECISIGGGCKFDSDHSPKCYK
jgi:hypothetical protein